MSDAGTLADDRLAKAGRAAVREGLRLWALDVIDPLASDKGEAAERSRKVIDGVITAAGWSWQVPYKGDGQVEWCGLFAAACWRAAGIDPRWLAPYFASTYRLDIWARYRNFHDKHPNHRPATGPHRRIAELLPTSTAIPFAPREGDILLIGDGSPVAGDHICIVTGFDAATRTFSTVEGNGRGLGPDRKKRSGIVVAQRYLGGSGFCARRLIRPAPHDLM